MNRIPVVGAAWAVALVLSVGCAEEEATPVDPANPPSFDLDEVERGVEQGADLQQLEAELEEQIGEATHFFEPSQQMKDAAAQQCLDDPELEEGYIKAVDPNDPEVIVSEFVVDCDTVRS